MGERKVFQNREKLDSVEGEIALSTHTLEDHQKQIVDLDAGWDAVVANDVSGLLDWLMMFICFSD